MYKNFNLTDEERKEIMEMHKSHGYKKPLNELDDKDIDLIRGKSTQKWSRAGKQFQQDFENDFADPAEEPVPYWKKDRPNPSNDSEIETDIRTNIRQANREIGTKEVDTSNQQAREERIKLRRRIASLVSHRDEFGGDDELDNLIRRLRDQALDMDDNGQPSVTSDETSNLNEAISGTPKMEKGKDYYGVSTKDGKKYLIKVLETTGVMGDCNVFFGETLIAKGYSMFVGGNFNTPSGVWAFKDPQMKSKYGDFKVTSTSNLNEGASRIKVKLNESDSSNRVKELWEKISEISKNYSDALKNLNDVGCDDSETYAEYYHSSGQMEPGDHDDYDDNDYHDNGYSHSQQSFADRLDYANSAEDPITRAERRMGA